MDKSEWATALSALLTGKALGVYSRLSETAALDYDKLKEALLRRYDLTMDGFRCPSRESRPDIGESPEQFIVRLTGYLTRWVELSNTEKSYEELCDLFIRDQFISACSKDLAIHIRERSPPGLSELAKVAEPVSHSSQETAGHKCYSSSERTATQSKGPK